MTNTQRIVARDESLQYIYTASNEELNQLVAAFKQRRETLKSINTARARSIMSVGDSVQFEHRNHKDSNEDGYIVGELTEMKVKWAHVATPTGNWKVRIANLYLTEEE